MRAAVIGRGTPGAYNLAGTGRLTVSQLADELGWYSIPVPELAVDAVGEMVGRLGFLPAQAQWISAFREPMIMSTAKARRELRWRPRHGALQTLRETITSPRGWTSSSARPLGPDTAARRPGLPYTGAVSSHGALRFARRRWGRHPVLHDASSSSGRSGRRSADDGDVEQFAGGGATVNVTSTDFALTAFTL